MEHKIISMDNYRESINAGVTTCEHAEHRTAGHDLINAKKNLITTVCPVCGERVVMDFDECINAFRAGRLSSIMVICQPCIDSQCDV